MPRNQGTSRKGKPKKGERAAGMGRALQKSHKNGANKGRGQGGGVTVSGGLAAPSISLSGDHQPEKMSLLELDHLDDFLIQADMAGREFASERYNVVIDTNCVEYHPNQSQRAKQEDQSTEFNAMNAPQFSFEELSVPRRPKWDADTTPAELDRMENEAFLEWRRAIAAKEEQVFAHQNKLHAYNAKTVTPYEKNLEVWRQMWRVLERADCILQLVDARNPLFYLSEDLRNYASELGKPMMVVVNKSDYLSPEQRRLWSQYFRTQQWDFVFFSAYDEQKKLDQAAHIDAHPADRVDEQNLVDEENDDDEAEGGDEAQTIGNDQTQQAKLIGNPEGGDLLESDDAERLLTRQELVDYMESFAATHNCKPNPRYDNRVQFGLVGFPNVGKSSVINVLVGSSKHTHGVVRVGVAAQPGKTKHFQTLFLPDNDNVMLCDCPGLVFPSFVSSTADLIAAGVYPIAQMRDHWPVIELICKRIPREVVNANYGIRLPEPTVMEMREQGLKKLPPPTAEEFLTTYCIARSMLAASSGVPDYTRASRIVIKDYVSGKLLFCHAPPSVVDMDAFHRETASTAMLKTEKLREKLHHNGDVLNAEDEELVVGLDPALDGVDDDLLDLVGTPNLSPESDRVTQTGKKHRTKGKKNKGKKNPDPYGCHTSPDDMLKQTYASSGVIVNAGKYSKGGYTRQRHYGGARSAATTANSET